MVFESSQKVHSQPDEGADVLSLRDVVHIIRSRIWLILLVVCSVTGITVGYTLMQTPMYESSIVVLVGQRQLTDASSGNLAANVEGVQRLTKTLTEAVARRPTAEAVVKQLDLGISPWEVLKNLKAQQIPDTQFIQVTYQDSDPERAQQVANAVGQGVSDLIYEVSPDVNGVTATVWEPAETPNTPVSPNLILNVLLALVGSTGLSLGLVFLLEFFDNRWHTPEQIERMSRVPNLSVAPTFTAPEKALEHEKAEKQ